MRLSHQSNEHIRTKNSTQKKRDNNHAGQHWVWSIVKWFSFFTLHAQIYTHWIQQYVFFNQPPPLTHVSPIARSVKDAIVFRPFPKDAKTQTQHQRHLSDSVTTASSKKTTKQCACLSLTLRSKCFRKRFVNIQIYTKKTSSSIKSKHQHAMYIYIYIRTAAR